MHPSQRVCESVTVSVESVYHSVRYSARFCPVRPLTEGIGSCIPVPTASHRGVSLLDCMCLKEVLVQQ